MDIRIDKKLLTQTDNITITGTWYTSFQSTSIPNTLGMHVQWERHTNRVIEISIMVRTIEQETYSDIWKMNSTTNLLHLVHPNRSLYSIRWFIFFSNVWGWTMSSIDHKFGHKQVIKWLTAYEAWSLMAVIGTGLEVYENRRKIHNYGEIKDNSFK